MNSNYPRAMAGRIKLPVQRRFRHWGYAFGVLWGVVAYLGLVQIEAGCKVITWFGSALDKSLYESANVGFFFASLILGVVIIAGSPRSKIDVVVGTISTFVLAWVCGPKELLEYDYGSVVKYPDILFTNATILGVTLGLCVGIQLVIQVLFRRSKGIPSFGEESK